MSKPLLTIAIPTWNRCQFLKEMVLSVALQAEKHKLADKVEIVVSDNASTDNTQQMVAELQAQTPVRIVYNRNEANIGAIKNVVNTVSLSSGQFWMLYGDDDLMVEGALPRILQTFKHNPKIPVFMFEQEQANGTDGEADTDKAQLLSIEDAARQHFYYIGNAGVFAINTADAQNQLAKWGVEKFQTCWPQTQLAFSAMAASGLPKPLLSTPITSSASPFHGENTIYTSWYIWETTFFSLYRAAVELRPIAGEAFFRAACDHVFSPRRVLRTAKYVALYTAYYDLPQDAAQTREAAWKSIGYAKGRAKVPLLLMWLVAAMPRLLKRAALSATMVLRRPTQAAMRMRELRESAEAHRLRRLEAAKPGPEKPRVYMVGDL